MKRKSGAPAAGLREGTIHRFKRTNPEGYNEMLVHLRDNTVAATAYAFAERMGEEPEVLNKKLQLFSAKQKVKSDPTAVNKMLVRGDGLLTQPKKLTLADQDLDTEELAFLEKFRSGELDFEEAQRMLAFKVFTRILQDPTQLKAADWLRSELVKIKREEMSMKKEEMERSWAMIFGGFMIPDRCPRCDFKLQPKAFHGLNQPDLLTVEEARLQQGND